MRRKFLSLGVPPCELRCDVTLVNGQCFGWKAVGENEWAGVFKKSVIVIKQEENDTLYHTRFGDDNELDADLRSFFNLSRGLCLDKLYQNWSQSDSRFREIAPKLVGVRLLRQDPVECLFSFICSSCNNIPRITSMLATLRRKWGTQLCTLDGETYYSFPSVDCLADVKEQDLRDCGFGYRSKFIVGTAKMLQEFGGAKWLLDLRQKPREEVQKELIKFPGVGRKVADCVSLFSLDKLDVVPVDTHVWQIACRDYNFPVGEKKNLNDKTYTAIGKLFRDLHGKEAGWAHSILFTADLPAFRERLGTAAPEKPKRKKSEKKGRAGKVKDETAATPATEPDLGGTVPVKSIKSEAKGGKRSEETDLEGTDPGQSIKSEAKREKRSEGTEAGAGKKGRRKIPKKWAENHGKFEVKKETTLLKTAAAGQQVQNLSKRKDIAVEPRKKSAKKKKEKFN